MGCSKQGFPVPNYPQSLFKLISFESVMPSNHLILCHPLLLLPSIFFGIRVFSFFFIFYFILFFTFTILYWFCHISKWIRHWYTCVPRPEPSSLLSPYTILLGRPSAPAPSIQYHASNWTGDSFHIWYYTCFNAILPNHPTLSLSHRVQKTVLYISVSFAVLYTGLLSCVNDSPTQHLLMRPAFFCFSLANSYFKVKYPVYRKVPFGLNWPNKWYGIFQHSQLIMCLSKETKVNNCFDVSLIQCLQFHTKQSLKNLIQVWILRIKNDVGPLQADISANSSWLADLSPLGQITGVPSF